jgi:hypothetical protein
MNSVFSKNLVAFAKNHKSFFVKNSNFSDMLPTIVVERDNKVLSFVTVDKLDVEMGFDAARICKLGFDPDSLTLIVDSYIYHSLSSEIPDNPNVSLKELFDQGNSNVKSCLICCHMDRDGNFKMISIPYSHKEGEFEWIDEEIFIENKGDVTTGGRIPLTLEKIMKMKSPLDKSENYFESDYNDFKKNNPLIGGEDFDEEFDLEKVRFHMARIAMSAMRDKNFFVADYISYSHPEWTFAKTVADVLLKGMIKDGFLLEESYDPCIEFFNQNFNSELFLPYGYNFEETINFAPRFETEFKEFLLSNEHWLLKNVKETIDSFVYEFQKLCIESTPFHVELISSIMKNLNLKDSPIKDFEKKGFNPEWN